MTKFSNRDSDLWPRIEMVVRWSCMSVNAFARHIGLPRGENLYQIKRGNNGLSIHVADMICEKFPEIDELWLLTGKNNMFLSMDKCRCREAAPDPCILRRQDRLILADYVSPGEFCPCCSRRECATPSAWPSDIRRI